MLGASLSDIFSIPVPALGVILRECELSPTMSVADFLSMGVAVPGTLIAIADYVMDNDLNVRLDQVAPVLQDCPIPLQLQAFSTRPANGLRKGGVSSWQQLVAMTPADLLALPAVGRKSAIEIIAVALSKAAVRSLQDHRQTTTSSPTASTALRDCGKTNESRDSPHGQSDPAQLAKAILSSLQIITRWAICIGDAETIGAALELTQSEKLPDDVSDTMQELLQMPLNLQTGIESNIAVAYDRLWKACGDERRREIFRRRIAVQPQTLDNLSAEMMVTRERVRQLQRAAEDSILAALLLPECAEIRWRAVQLRRRLGTTISANNMVVHEALASACHGIAEDSTTAKTLMLWLAGPYRMDKQTGWLFAEEPDTVDKVGPRTEIGPPPQSSLLKSLTEEGIVDIEEAKARVAAAGLVPGAIEDWIEICPFRDVGGKLILWQGNVADKAAALLTVIKRPTTADELNSMIAEGHSVRALRDRLLGDERFIRTDRFRMGLRTWGLEEYSGIVDEIEEEIARRGGEADLHDLIQNLTERFGLRGSSIASYSSVPRFVVDSGRIHVRRPDEPFVPSRTLFNEAHAFLLEENRCSYRVRVDEDILRGSGRPLPQGVGSWLGVLPGMRREFHFRDGDVLLISWPDSALQGPALGSLRRQALARVANPGDWLLLEFDRSSDEVEAMLVTRSEMETATGWLRGTLLTGIDAGSELEFEQLLIQAVGASSERDLRKKCRDRGDPELAELVRVSTSPALEEALERIKGLL